MKRILLSLLLFAGLGLLPACATPLVIPSQVSWHMQLDGRLQKPDRQLYDIDLYDTPAKTIGDLKAVGRIVICYFSAGTWEDWRPDAADYPAAALGAPLADWPGERWLDIRRADVRALLSKRLDLAVSKGCHGVDPDNVDGYSNANGLQLTAADQLDFNRWLAREAHQRDLAVGLKNAVELLPQLVDDFDFAINESCYVYKECDGYRLFRQQGKAVLIADYRAYSSNLCTQAAASGYRLQFFKRSLKGVGTPCK
ncbi:endo alpha-1,4 polygalactosaminidase [Pseudomonas sp. MBLB4136]|uniref:endo alpha-1,4 polygalactosaminidase n=1 Tax=Pseudomonas sp. MBLB4136 TaxID=3451558 RepID=UPI003F74B51C